MGILIVLSRMVTSAATTITATVPTEDRRSRTTATLRGSCGRPVTSTAMTVSTAVPTGAFISPGTNDDYTWRVHPSGDVGNYYDYFYYSYGRESPYTVIIINYSACCVGSVGDLVGGDVNDCSYGFIRINLSIITEK